MHTVRTINFYRKKVANFLSLGNYMKNAYPADELMPLTCKGRTRGRTPSRGDVDDALGNFQLTLVDALGSFGNIF